MKYCYTNERLKKQSGATWKMLILIFILLNSLVLKMSAQGTTVSGTVVDEKNQPLTGVNVVVKGKTTGTVTDLDGKFSINATGTDVLNFTYVGYKSEEIAVGNQTQMNVTLKEEVTALNEVVVVGYGVQKKSDLTGAVASIKADDIKNMPATRVDEALQGKAAGVMVLQNTGQPGADPQIRVRGYATINGGTPLVVIDGVSGGSLKDLNPGDIESMEVLKDAASQAIYGSAGANGVILVSTKRGNENQFHANLDMFWGSEQPWRKDNENVANGPEYAAIYNLTHPNYFKNIDNTYRSHNDSTQSLTDVNWIDKIFRSAMVQNYNLSVNTGSKKATIYSGLGYSNENGSVLRTYNKKYTFKLNSDIQVLKRLKVGESLSLSENISSNQGEHNEYSSPLSQAIQMIPIIPVFAKDGSGNYAYRNDSVSCNITNPSAAINYNNNKATSKTIFGNVYLKLDLIKGLSYETHFGYNANSSLYASYTPAYFIGDTAEENSSLNSPINAVNRNTNTSQSWQFQNYVTYDLNLIEKINLTFVGGMESNYYTNTFVNKTAKGVDMLNKNWEDYNDTTLHPLAPEKTNVVKGYAYFARINFDFVKIFLLQGNIRRDYSSKFGVNQRAGTFPAISAGIKFSEIEFIKDLNIINFGKIRAGYGETGNSDIQPFLYNSTLGILPINGYPFGSPLVNQQGAALLTAGNADLHWETVITRNIGIDLGFLKNRLTISADYFYRNNKNMLLRKSVPLTVGYVTTSATQELGDSKLDTRPQVNYGTLDNKGFEITLGYKDKIGDFEYELNANISHIETRIKSIGDPLYGTGARGISSVTKTVNEGVVSAFYGYRTNGIYKDGDFTWFKGKNNKWALVAADPSGKNLVPGTNVDGLPDTLHVVNSSAKPGDFKFVDANNDGTIDTKDLVQIGDPNPKFTYGFSLNLKYSSIDLSMFFQGSYGNNIFNLLKVNNFTINNGGLNVAPDLINSYIPATWNSKSAAVVPIMLTPARNTNTGEPRLDPTLGTPSDFYVEDGSYMRLKNLQIGYTLPSSLTQKVKISKLRVYVGAKNLLTFTKYTGFDPEVGENTSVQYPILEKGFDRGTYPQSKMYLVGLNLTF